MSEVIEQYDDSSDLTVGLPVINNYELLAEDQSIFDTELRYGVKLGGYNLLVPASIESEIITIPDIFSIPNTTDSMIGLISVRGRFAPVFDLGKMLGLELKKRQTSIIVLKINGDFLAFPYDSRHSLKLPASVAENHPTLPDTLARFASEIHQIDQEFWIEFDFKTCIEQFTSKISQ
jgi:chemotaxis signal transduction protein